MRAVLGAVVIAADICHAMSETLHPRDHAEPLR